MGKKYHLVNNYPTGKKLPSGANQRKADVKTFDKKPTKQQIKNSLKNKPAGSVGFVTSTAKGQKGFKKEGKTFRK